MRLRMSVVVAVVCLLVAVISAQADRGRITGVVTDASGAVLPGVTVSLSGVESRTTVTNDRGEFAFEGVRPGQYELKATLPGFVEIKQQVSLRVGGAVRLTLKMAVGALQESVTVSAEAPGDAQRRRSVGGSRPLAVGGGASGECIAPA
jgi:hypothetical protein